MRSNPDSQQGTTDPNPVQGGEGLHAGGGVPAGAGGGAATRQSGFRRFGTRFVTEHLIWLVLLVVILYGLTVPGFASSTNLLNVLWASAPLALTALGLFFVLISGNLDLSLESTYGFAPAIAILFMLRWLPALVPAPVA